MLSDWLSCFRLRHDPFVFVRARFILFCLLLTVCTAGGEETNLLSKLEPVPPFAEVAAVAKADGIPLNGIVPVAATHDLAPGDSLTALITLHQKGGRRTEWLVYFEVEARTNNPAGKTNKPEVLYNSTGDKFVFSNSPATFRIRSIGPYSDYDSFWGKPVAKDNSASASVNGAFLGLGLERGAEVIHRMCAAHGTNFDFWISGRPPPRKEVEKNQKIAATLNLTQEEKRALAEWQPTLMSYFEAVGETPDLDGIMWKVVNLPSMWSIVRHVGVTAWIGMDIEKVSPLTLPAGWNLPGGSNVYTLPIFVDLNRQPALKAALFVTDPRPSFLACGGIVGFVAWNPVDEENYVTLRVISTRWANGNAEARTSTSK